MANSRDDAERRAIQAIRDADPARILTSPDGYALTVGRLCELALQSTIAPQSERGEQDTAKEAGKCDRNWWRAQGIEACMDRMDVMEAQRIAAIRADGGSATVPEGWKLVPKEPTQEMVSAGDAHEHRFSDIIYRAMLAAAPTNEGQR